MRTRLLSVLTLTAVISIALQTTAGEPLPSDPRVETGVLPNGVKWMYRQHDMPEGRMALMINVDSGSLNETEDQRGLAHYIEHMAFNGSENFPPGELVPYFESIGMQFGADLNAFTGFDQTAYMLFLPDTESETVDKGLMVLSDYAFRLLFLDEEIVKERGVILSELTSGMGVGQRLRDKLFASVFEGTRLAERLPIGIEKVIRGADRDTFLDYYRTWYRPDNVTLMLIGDAPREQFMASIEKWFGTYTPKEPARPQEGPGFKPFSSERAFVLTDPEHAEGNVDIYNIEPGRAATTTVEQARVDLVEQVGNWILARRCEQRVKKGEATFLFAGASVSSVFNEGILINATASGKPADWEKMLEELVYEVNRAREHGFLEQELELARKELLASAERAVETEPTRAARGMIMEMNGSVADEEPLLSAGQMLDLMKRLVPTIKLAEVNEAFSKHFAPGTFAYVVTLPEKDDVKVPSEADVLAAAKAAQARKTEAWTWEERPTTILEEEPKPGKVVEKSVDEDLKITSAWLSNGVRVHHRFMDYKKDTVLVGISLAGGRIEETAENAGITTVASLILDQPATSRLRSTDIEDILTGKKIGFGGNADDDYVVLNFSGSPEDLELGFQLAHALLTDGKLEESRFDRWKEEASQRYAMVSMMPQYVALKTLFAKVSGNDPRRFLLPDPDLIARQSVKQSQAWYDNLCRRAPIEATVVGDIQLDEAMKLVEKYIGSLSKRDRSAAYLDKLRDMQAEPGPYKERVSVNTITPIDMIVYGFIGCDAKEVDDNRALNLAALMLDSRLIKRVREELGLVYSIGAQTMPAEAYRNGGIFLTGAPSQQVGKGEDVAREIAAIYDAFAKDGPTAEEIENARKQIANQLDTQLKEPSFWFGVIQHLELHQKNLDTLKDIPGKYAAITAEQIRDVFRKYYTPARTFDVIGAPASTEAPAEAGAKE